MFLIRVEIEESHLDKVYHHLHHAESLKLLERARLQLLSVVGFSSESLIETGLYPVISSIDVKYLREVKAGPYIATCENVKVEGRTIRIGQRLINEKGKVCVAADVASMLLSAKSGRATLPPRELERIFNNLGVP